MTFEDLSFVERMEITREGWQHPAVGQYEMFAGHGRGGMGLVLESDEAVWERMAAHRTREAEEAVHRTAMEAARRNIERENMRAENVLAWCIAYPIECDDDGFHVVGTGENRRLERKPEPSPPTIPEQQRTQNAGQEQPANAGNVGAGSAPQTAPPPENNVGSRPNALTPEQIREIVQALVAGDN